GEEKPAIIQLLKSIHEMDTFHADFIYTSIDTENEPEETQELIQGQIWVKNPKYQLLLDEQEIICNRQVIWNYLPQAQEVQLNTYNPEQEALDPIKLLTLYRTGFIPTTLKKEPIPGKLCDILELV